MRRVDVTAVNLGLRNAASVNVGGLLSFVRM